MAKHAYTITINRLPSGRDPIEYTYRKTACTLTCSKAAASVSYTSSALKSFDDLISFRVDLVKDAMRKMYLLHAMRCGAALKVRKVILTIDGESREYGKDAPGFPFLYSMLTSKDLALPESWKDRDFQSAVLTATKSATDNDLRFACLFSFLAGTGKQFEIERFTCYWTAVNSHYNYLLECSKPFYASSLGAADFASLSKRKQKDFSGDTVGLGAMVSLLQCGGKLSSQGERTTFRQQYGAVKSHLRHYSKDQLRTLAADLAAHRTDPGWFPEGPLGEHLRECASRNGISAWGFLCLDYAYYMRCNYLHGSKTTILFTAANDPELAAFRALNILLGEYLKEVLPQMFRENWIGQAEYDRIDAGL